jgi:hypothetical protein
MLKWCLITILALLTAGCGIATMQQCRTDMMRSKDAYDACLRAHPSDPNICEGLRKAYDADLRAYEATRAGLNPGHTISIQNNN